MTKRAHRVPNGMYIWIAVIVTIGVIVYIVQRFAFFPLHFLDSFTTNSVPSSLTLPSVPGTEHWSSYAPKLSGFKLRYPSEYKVKYDNSMGTTFVEQRPLTNSGNAYFVSVKRISGTKTLFGADFDTVFAAKNGYRHAVTMSSTPYASRYEKTASMGINGLPAISYRHHFLDKNGAMKLICRGYILRSASGEQYEFTELAAANETDLHETFPLFVRSFSLY